MFPLDVVIKPLVAKDECPVAKAAVFKSTGENDSLKMQTIQAFDVFLLFLHRQCVNFAPKQPVLG